MGPCSTGWPDPEDHQCLQRDLLGAKAHAESHETVAESEEVEAGGKRTTAGNSDGARVFAISRVDVPTLPSSFHVNDVKVTAAVQLLRSRARRIADKNSIKVVWRNETFQGTDVSA